MLHQCSRWENLHLPRCIGPETCDHFSNQSMISSPHSRAPDRLSPSRAALVPPSSRLWHSDQNLLEKCLHLRTCPSSGIIHLTESQEWVSRVVFLPGRCHPHRDSSLLARGKTRMTFLIVILCFLGRFVLCILALAFALDVLAFAFAFAVFAFAVFAFALALRIRSELHPHRLAVDVLPCSRDLEDLFLTLFGMRRSFTRMTSIPSIVTPILISSSKVFVIGSRSRARFSRTPPAWLECRL